MRSNHYDVIVCGLGGNGSLGLRALSQRKNLRVLGIEARKMADAGDGSRGETRLLRRSYFENPRYVPLVSKSLEAFRNLQTESETPLLRETPLLFFGESEHPVLKGARSCLLEYGLADITPDTTQLSISGFSSAPVLIERDAAILFPEKIMAHCLNQAKANGAEILDQTPIMDLRFNAGSVEIKTAKGSLFAEKLLLTAGAWIPSLMPNSLIPIEIREAGVFWFRENGPKITAPFIIADGEETIYGFPSVGNGVKVGSYRTGRLLTSPDERENTNRVGLLEIQNLIRKYLPTLDLEPIASRSCFFDFGPQENLLLDFHPLNHRAVFIAAGSGHGYKMAPALVEDALTLLLEGRRPQASRFLALPS